MLPIRSHILRKLTDTFICCAPALVSEVATSLSRFPLPSYLLSSGCSPAIIYLAPYAPYSVAYSARAPWHTSLLRASACERSGDSPLHAVCSLFSRILCESSLTRFFTALTLVSESATSLSRFPLPSYLLSGGCSPAIIYPTPGAPYSVAPFVKAPCTLLCCAPALANKWRPRPFQVPFCPLIY